MEGDLSLSTISAYATELMKEMGCILGLTALNQERQVELSLIGKEMDVRGYPVSSSGLADEVLPSVPVRSGMVKSHDDSENIEEEGAIIIRSKRMK